MKKPLFAVLVVFAGVSWATAANTDDEQTRSQVDRVFADFEKNDSPGCAVGVIRDGNILYSKGYGLASVELNAPITAQTVFDIGSTSKQFTAASILLLQQEGKLSISDDVRKYIPELPDYSKGEGRKITILNLLNHTSGLRDYLALLQLSGISADSVTTDDDALALIIRQKKLNFATGSEWAYSNTGFFLLSVIVKRVSGTTLREFASKNIFQPLEMTHTMFRDDHTLLIRHRALAYDPEKSGYKLNVSYYEQLGDGAVHTSVEDMAKWDENFYSGRVGGKDLIAELQERGKLNSGKTLDYAKGLFLQQFRGLPVVRHGGAWGGYRAELLRFPNQHFSVACLCNLANANPEKLTEQVAGVYLGALMKPEQQASRSIIDPHAAAGVSLTGAHLAAIVGMYRSEAKRNIARISVMKGKLQWEIYGSTFGLRALSPTEFLPLDFPVDAKLTFHLASDRNSRTLEISGDEMIAAVYQGVDEFVPSEDKLGSYAGDFRADELGVIYRMRVLDRQLKLVELADQSGVPRTGMPVPAALRPTITDEFEISNQGITIHFLKNAKGEIAGFNLDSGRSSSIQFSRTNELGNTPTRF